MKILLITSNATIEKLFVLSAEKKGDEVSIGTAENIPEGVFDAVFIDKDLYSEELFENLKTLFPNAKFVLIVSKNDEKIVGFNDYLTKPFLPTDLMDLLEKLPNMTTDEQNIENDDIDIESFEDLKDLDVGDEDLGLDDIEGIDDLKDDLNFDLDENNLDLDMEEAAQVETEEGEVEPLEETQSDELDIDDMFEDLESEEDLKNLDAKDEFVAGDEEDFEISEEELEGEAPDDDIEESFEIDETELVDEENEEIPELNEEGIIQENGEIENEELGEIDETPLEEPTEEIETDIEEAENEEPVETKEEELETLNEETEPEAVLEEKTEQNETPETEEIPEENLEEFDLENINIDEEPEEITASEENLEGENIEELDSELSDIDEMQLAEVLGEELPKEENVEEIEENLEEIGDESIEEINIDDKIPEIQEAHELEEAINHSESITPQEKTLGSILNINWEELKKAKAKVTITIDFGD